MDPRPQDTSSLDDRVRLERNLAKVRWFAVALGVYLVTQPSSGALPPPPVKLVVVGELLIGMLAVGNLFLWVLLRRPDSGRYLDRLGACMFALDSVVVFALVWTSSYTPLDTTWAVTYILPLEGALRYRLRGAIGIALVALVNELVRDFYLSIQFSGYRFDPGSPLFRGGMGLIIAMVAGLMAQSLGREAERAHRAARKEAAARSEIGAFNSIILAGLSTDDVDQSLPVMADAMAEQLKFETLAILIVEGDALVAKAIRGMPSRVLGDRIPLGTGVTGAVAATGQSLLVPDVREFPSYIPVGADIRSEMAVPIKTSGEVIGVLDIESRHEGAFDRNALLMAERLGRQISLVVQSLRLRAQERETLERLRELEEMKSDFLAIANHELRTPLAAVRGCIRTLVLHRRALPDREVDEFLERADRRSEDLGRLIEDLLVASRMDSASLDLHPDEVELEVLLRDVVESFPQRQQARVDLRVGSGRPRVDGYRLGQIVRNLVENALKFSPEEDAVTVEAEVDGDGLTVRVRDRGDGIPPEKLPLIFDRFRQLDPSLTRQKEGMGLGLYIVKTLTERMGGRLDVESSPGVGSSFTVLLPSAAPSDHPRSESLRPVG